MNKEEEMNKELKVHKRIINGYTQNTELHTGIFEMSNVADSARYRGGA